MSENHVIWVSRYIHDLERNRMIPADERQDEVYLYETCVHHHKAHLDNSGYDLFDPLYVEPKANHIGRRYCIRTAMNVPGKDSPARTRPVVGLVFWPQQKHART